MSVPKKRILVVDDEPFVCDAVKMMLAFDGHDVVTTNDAKEALGIFDPDKFDVVITDYAMPGMKGDELAATIRQAPPPAVVMITAYAEMLQSSGKNCPALIPHQAKTVSSRAPARGNFQRDSRGQIQGRGQIQFQAGLTQ